MGKLAEYLKTEAETIRADKMRRRSSLQEWVGLLDGLYRQVDNWLTASDPEGLLERTVDTVRLVDPALGEYGAPVRRIRLGDCVAELMPRARFVAMLVRPPGTEKPTRAHGFVELRGDPGPQSYHLFQLPDNRWYIQSEPDNLRVSDNPVELLDADRFETALASLLR